MLENNHSYKINNDSTISYSQIETKSLANKRKKSFYSTMRTRSSVILDNNPTPWYIRDNNLYYVGVDQNFKGAYQVRIDMISVNEIEELSTYNKKEIFAVEINNNIRRFHVERIHNMRFDKDEFSRLYYDFTVRKSKNIVLISYFENRLCVYESLPTSNSLELCSCEELILSPPFQIFEDSDQLFILDSKSDLFNLTIYQSGKISLRPEKEKTRSSFIRPDGTLQIKND
jgi:hypothetical protein